MNPLRVTATNYRSFEMLDIDLPAGCTAVTGANGAGKSSLINLIDLAPFGPETRTLADYLTRGSNGDLELTMEFEHEGEVYRVRRGFSAKGRGKSTLDFERLAERMAYYDNGRDTGPDEHPAIAWEPLTQGTAKETQSLIEQTIGLSRKTWRASAFLAQSDGGAFTEADPRDRKSILAEVLALDAWEQLLALAHADRTDAERSLTLLDGETAVLREQADRRAYAETEATEADQAARSAQIFLNRAEHDLSEIAEQVRAAENAAAARHAAEAELARARAEHARLQEVKAEADRCVVDKQATLDEIATLATVDQVVELEREAAELRDRQAAEQLASQEYDAAKRERDLKVAQRDAIVGQANDMRAKATLLRERGDALEAAGPGESVCDHCGQTLGVEALAASLLKLRGDADELDAAAGDRDQQAAAITVADIGDPPTADADLAERIRGNQGWLTGARAEQEQRARLTERIRALDEKIAAAATDDFQAQLFAAGETLKDAEAALAEVGDTTVDVAALQGRVLLAQGRVDNARTLLDAARQRKTLADEHLRRVHDAETKLADTAARREQLQAEIDLTTDLEKAYGRDGIPALIMESVAIPKIEAAADAALAALGASFRIELRTQRALKSGDGLRDTLDVVVIDDSEVAPYETFSGGEKTRINIAVASAIGECAGAKSDVLILDEPDGLDSDGFACLAEMLRGLVAGGIFEKAYVVSHHPDLAGAFDSTLEVVKDEQGSRVIGVAA